MHDFVMSVWPCFPLPVIELANLAQVCGYVRHVT